MQITGAKELAEVLRRLPTALRNQAISTGVSKGADIMVARMKENAPVGKTVHFTRKRRPLFPGFLRDFGIKKWKVRSRSPDVVAYNVGIKKGSEAWYGKLREFEYGGVKGPAHPWARPAFDDTAAQVMRTIGEELGKAVVKAAARLAGPYARVRKALVRS